MKGVISKPGPFSLRPQTHLTTCCSDVFVLGLCSCTCTCTCIMSSMPIEKKSFLLRLTKIYQSARQIQLQFLIIIVIVTKCLCREFHYFLTISLCLIPQLRELYRFDIFEEKVFGIRAGKGCSSSFHSDLGDLLKFLQVSDGLSRIWKYVPQVQPYIMQKHNWAHKPSSLWS